MTDAAFEQMKLILEKSPVAMLLSAGPEERVVLANKKFTELFGYRQEDIPDVEHWWPLAYPDEAYRTEVRAEWTWKTEKAARKRTDIEPMEAMVTCKDGSRRHIRFHLSPVGSGSKSLITFFDVTERTRERMALTETERRYQELFESSRDGFVAVNAQGRIIDCNQAYCKMLGYTLDELKQLPDFHEITPEKWRDWERVEIWNNRLLKHGFSGIFEKEYIRKDGSVFPVELTSYAIRDEQGELKYMWEIVRDISNLKSTEDALRQSEKKYRTLVESLQEGVWEIDREANTTFVNRRMAEMLGYGVEEMKGKSLFSFMNEAAAVDARKLMQRREMGVAEQHEFRFLKKDGSPVFTILEAVPVVDPVGNFRGAIAGVIDITERKQIEEQLAESEQRYRTLVDMADDAILLTAPDGRIFSANPAACRMFGRTEEEVCSLGRAGVVVQDEKLKQAVAERDKAGSLSAELNFYGPNGETFPGDVSSVVFQSENGEARTSMVIRDITERKAAARALEQSEERYRSLFEETKDTIITTTPDGKILDINPAGVELFGCETREELLLAFDNAQKLYADAEDRGPIIDALRNHGYIRDIEVALRRKNGEIFHVSASFLPTLDECGELVALRGIYRDVSERRKLEEQLRQSQKMESIGRLAGGVAHDFNNLLTSIQGYINLAQMKIPQDDPAQEELRVSNDACRRAAEVTRELLFFSRQQRIRLEQMELNRVIEGHLKLLHRVIGEQYSIVTHLRDDLWTVNADVSHIDQVIMKLVINARDAMPEGGDIAISTENVTVDDQYASGHPGSRAGRFVRLSIKDTGMGMDAEMLSHIFEPFYTTKSLAKGSGMGLPVIDGIISQHEGWIDVESSPGRGSVFHIYLPASLSEPRRRASSTPASIDLEQIQGDGEKILLVEDEESVRRLAERILTRNGYSVTTAATAEEAHQIFSRSQGDFQMVFSDVVLPREDGIELVERLREEKPDIKVLLASGYSDGAGRQDIADKNYPFLNKPYTMQQVLQKLAEVLGAD